jgi:HD-GYP domain-containing protein (c-di-GMP phosphodiesterase class II)
MSTLIASPSLRHRGVATWRARTRDAAPQRRPPPSRTRHYLPLALLTTALVVLLPPALVSAVVPRGSLLMIAVSGLTTVAVSMGIAGAGAAFWKRRPGSRDIVFADLLLWGWLRRYSAERRLSQARTLFDSARKSGPAVSIELVTGLSRLLEARDAYTHRHGQRVARHATRIARAMHLSPVEIAKIQTAAAVHDVGKLYTPREILENPNRLTDAEYEVAKRHAAWGARMLAALGDEEITDMVRHHHERIDGHGYPDGLAGQEIPLGARIIAVADTFDAITSSRAYRTACTQKNALDVLTEEAGTQLDPAAVAAFRARYSARRSVAATALATTAPGRILAALQTATQGLVSGAAGILPAAGLAGLLAVSPGVHHGGLAVRGVHGLPALSQAPHSVTAGGESAAPGGIRHAASTKPRISPPQTIRTPARTSPTSTPSRPNRAPSTGPNDPTGAASPPPTSSPVPPTPPVPAPPVVPTPPVTPPTVTPPVSLPNLPDVHLPPVPVPVPAVPGGGVAPTVVPAGAILPAHG